MDPRQIISRAALEEEYHFDLPHALMEADIHSITTNDIEEVMIRGTINQRKTKSNRYRLRYRDIQIVVDIVFYQVTIITVMRD